MHPLWMQTGNTGECYHGYTIKKAEVTAMNKESILKNTVSALLDVSRVISMAEGIGVSFDVGYANNNNIGAYLTHAYQNNIDLALSCLLDGRGEEGNFEELDNGLEEIIESNACGYLMENRKAVLEKTVVEIYALAGEIL